MAKNLDEYRCKLVSKIMQSGSDQEVRRYFNAAIKGLKDHNVNGYITVRFIDKIIHELNQLQHSEFSISERSNIESGIRYGDNLKKKITSPVSL